MLNENENNKSNQENNDNCVFCKIVQKELPAEIVFENKNILVFKDIHPIAPIHLLIIPKKHIKSLNELTEKDQQLVGEMIIVGKNLAHDLKISEKGYKILFRIGEDGGQEVPHLHLHLIGGAPLYEEIRPLNNSV